MGQPRVAKVDVLAVAGDGAGRLSPEILARPETAPVVRPPRVVGRGTPPRPGRHAPFGAERGPINAQVEALEVVPREVGQTQTTPRPPTPVGEAPDIGRQVDAAEARPVLGRRVPVGLALVRVGGAKAIVHAMDARQVVARLAAVGAAVVAPEGLLHGAPAGRRPPAIGQVAAVPQVGPPQKGVEVEGRATGVRLALAETSGPVPLVLGPSRGRVGETYPGLAATGRRTKALGAPVAVRVPARRGEPRRAPAPT